MPMHWMILTSLRYAGMMSRHVARRTSGLLVECGGVVIRDAGYRTRVSAKRVQAGCVTERVFAIGGFARRTPMHGVHVAGRIVTHGKPASAPAPNCPKRARHIDEGRDAPPALHRRRGVVHLEPRFTTHRRKTDHDTLAVFGR